MITLVESDWVVRVPLAESENTWPSPLGRIREYLAESPWPNPRMLGRVPLAEFENT